MKNLLIEYVTWCAKNNDIQAHWLHTWTDAGGELRGNVIAGDRIIMWPYPDHMDFGIRFGVVANVLTVIGVSVGKGTYFQYEVAGNIGGHYWIREQEGFHRLAVFKWIPHIDQLLTAGFVNDAAGWWDALWNDALYR